MSLNRWTPFRLNWEQFAVSESESLIFTESRGSWSGSSMKSQYLLDKEPRSGPLMECDGLFVSHNLNETAETLSHGLTRLWKLKGIVQLNMKICWQFTHPQAIQDVDEFVSSSDFFIGFFCICHPFLWKCLLRMSKHRKSNLNQIFLWRTKVSEAVCKCDWHNVRSYLFFNVRKIQMKILDSVCNDLYSAMDALQWMGAVRMRVQTADKNITIIHK